MSTAIDYSQKVEKIRDRFDEFNVSQPSPSEVNDWLHDQNDVWFQAQNAFRLQMGLFAYYEPADVPGYQKRLIYLSQHPIEHPELPYLGYENDPNALTPDWKEKAQGFRIVREDEIRSDSLPYFVRALNQIIMKTDVRLDVSFLTDFEFSNKVIFAPCGEMSASILGWLIKRVPKGIKEIDDQPVENVLDTKIEVFDPDEVETALIKSWNPKIRFNYNSIIPISFRSVFEKLGLATSTHNHRLLNLLRWLKEDTPTRKALDIENPLGKDKVVIEEALRAFENNQEYDEAVLFPALIRIFLRSRLDAGQWRHVCRFSLPGHFLLRANETFTRSWIVIPIHSDSSNKEIDGFFLGTLNSTAHSIDFKSNLLNIKRMISALSRYFSDFIYEGLLRQHFAEKSAREAVLENIKGIPKTQLGNFTFVGMSFKLKEALKIANAASLSLQPEPVLIQGETGTGKGRVAEAIHYNSNRKDKPFRKINCGGITETLLESDLFGHTKGAFTGADTRKEGLIKVTDGGTFFLDEIGEAPLSIQVKLLQVIEDKQLRKVGSTVEESIDVRFIAATNVDLREAMKAGKFRKDLFFRLQGTEIYLPPLRESREDILPLAKHFLKKYYLLYNWKNCPVLSDEINKCLITDLWPGNVRQLENQIKRALDQLYVSENISHIWTPENVGSILVPNHDSSTLAIDRSPHEYKTNLNVSEQWTEYEKSCLASPAPINHGRNTGLLLKSLWEKGAPSDYDLLVKNARISFGKKATKHVKLCCPVCRGGGWGDGTSGAKEFLEGLSSLIAEGKGNEYTFIASSFVYPDDAAKQEKVVRVKGRLKRFRLGQ